jgi:predicted ATPase/class 3 adenylate cyclase
MATNLPSGTVTFLFTDVEGSTRLWEQFPEAMRPTLARHDDMLHQAIQKHGGRIIKTTGDGVHAAFDTAVNGIGAALAAQQSLHGAAWDEITPHQLRVRMGLHTGEAEERSGDYFGPALNRAARLMSVAHGGQTLLSATAASLVRDQLPEASSLRDLGEHRLRDLVRTERIYQLIHPALPADFPPLRSLDAFPNNLPVQLTSFIGRERELAEARERLASARLLTLIGPGGTGKTRLSLQLAADLMPSFPDGVWLIELASQTDPALVLQSVASIFRLREQLGMPLNELLIDYLREKDMLLVMDNCEHLIDACAQLSDQWLRSCTHLKMIISSREALGIAGETVYRVPPLSLPGAGYGTRTAVLQCESAQLFIERASAAKPKFAVTDQNAESVAQICRRLDGIPLALELAAARITAFSPEQIAAHLDDRFRLLTGGSRTALPRQQTLRALIDWSYDLLSLEERCLLRRLSVFVGGWTYEAAEAICADLDVLDLLTQLVNKSLVSVDDEAAEPRYRLLETVRQYARDKLLEAGETEQTRGKHFGYFLALAEQAAPKLRSFGASEWVTRLDAEHDNLRAAMQWALENRLEDLLRMIPLLSYFWNRRGYEEEARSVIREALEHASRLPQFQGDADADKLRLLGESWLALAMQAFSQGDNMGASEASDKAAELARRIGDKRLLAISLGFRATGSISLGIMDGIPEMLEEGLAAATESSDKVAVGLPLAMYAQVYGVMTGDFQKAWADMEQGRALLKEGGDDWGSTMAFLSASMIAKFRGDYAEARKRFLAIEPLFRDLGDQHRTNMVKSELAHIERYEGHYAAAKAMYRETITEWQRIGHRAAVAHQLECFASLAMQDEQPERAARLFGAAEALRERIGIEMTIPEHEEYERTISVLRSGMDPSTFAAAWAEGRALGMDQAIDFAVSPPGKAL